MDIPGVATVDIAQMYGVYLNLDRGSFSFRIGNTVAKLAMDELPNLAPPAAVLVSPDYLDFVANVIPLVPVLAPGLDISLDTDAEKYQGFLVYQLFLLNPTTFQGDFVAAADFLQTELNLDGFKVEFQDIGFGYDDGKRLARAEAVKFFIPGEYLTVHAHYLTIGQRFNEFLPFIQYGHTYTASGGIISQSISSLIPAIANTIGLSDRFQKTYSIGLRWDIYKGIALKFQADHMTSFKGTDGGFTSKPSKNPNLLSIAIDAVF
ncbi:MAG: hypothetical protein JKY67_18700 [Pseudomonadales bacterium]|nr:hypothetical protein [Pseudomonadales bacterium]